MIQNIKNIIIFICSVLLCSYKPVAFDTKKNASLPVHSAARYENESYANAKSRYLERLNIQNQKLPKTLRQKKLMQFPAGSAMEQQKPLKEIDYSNVPLVDSYDELVEIFNAIRDDKSMLKDHLDNARTISWLYPTDGCYARAGVGYLVAENKNFVLPKKIFAFGALGLPTPYPYPGQSNPGNLPRGAIFVEWMYHVALILGVRGTADNVDTNTYYVLDPSVQPYKPLPVKIWFNRITKGDTPLGVVCDGNTYVPQDQCLSPDNLDANRQGILDEENIQNNHIFCENDGKKDITGYLCLEKQGLEHLKLMDNDPLGMNPPWQFFQLPVGDMYTTSLRGGTIEIAAEHLYQNMVTKKSNGLSVVKKPENLFFDPGTCQSITDDPIDMCLFRITYTGGSWSNNIPLILSDGYSIRYIFVDLVMP